MTQVIEQLKQRIEQLKDSLYKHYSIEVESRLSELERIVTILCSCKPINEDFESEWKRYCDSKGDGAVTMNIKDVAKHFVVWQKECNQKELQIAEEHGILTGMNMEREKMMKDAIICEVHQTNVDDIKLDSVEICSDGLILDNKKFKAGDKVKVIIIKE